MTARVSTGPVHVGFHTLRGPSILAFWLPVPPNYIPVHVAAPCVLLRNTFTKLSLTKRMAPCFRLCLFNVILTRKTFPTCCLTVARIPLKIADE